MKNKEIVKSIVVLVVICLLTSAALAVVNHFTAPVSAANAEARAQQARLDAVPDAADFAPIEAALPDGVVSAYAALDAAGTPTSYLFTVEGKGFGGTIQVLCVIGMDGRIRTCRTMDVSSETTTLGGQTANGATPASTPGRTLPSPASAPSPARPSPPPPTAAVSRPRSRRLSL